MNKTFTAYHELMLGTGKTTFAASGRIENLLAEVDLQERLNTELVVPVLLLFNYSIQSIASFTYH